MEFKQGGQAIQRLRRARGLTQEQLAEKAGISSNSVSRIERGALVPALPTLIDLCNALETGADAVLAAYLAADTPIRWTPLAEKMRSMDLEKQRKLEVLLNCMMETI